MKTRFITSIVPLLFFTVLLHAQKTVRDSLKAFTVSVVQNALEKGEKKLAVWDFTDMNKETSNFGSYIAEQFSVYAESVPSIELMDRQNLKSLLNEHKLKSEGYIDKNTIMELGKFKDVDAVVVGSVIMAGKDFQVVVKVIETSLGRTVAADEQFFFIDDRMAAILGIEPNGSGDSNSGNQNTTNRGFNRPLNSNEQYNNAATVSRDCEVKGTGDYCFYNNSKKTLRIIVDIELIAKPGEILINGYRGPDDYILLKPGDSKCIYNVNTEGRKSFKALIDIPNQYSNLTLYDKGNFTVEKCKSKTYNIK